MSTPSISDVIRKNNAKDSAVNEYPVTPNFRTDAEGVTEHVIDDEYTTFNATEIAGGDFDLVGAIMAIANGDAEFKSVDEEGEAVLQGMEHAFQAGALFAHLFAGEIEEDPEIVRMGFQTYLLAQLALVGQE